MDTACRLSMSKLKDRKDHNGSMPAPDIQSGVSGDVTLMTWVAGRTICAYRYEKGTNASQCGANQSTLLHDAVPLDETRRPELLMGPGINTCREDPPGRRVTLK